MKFSNLVLGASFIAGVGVLSAVPRPGGTGEPDIQITPQQAQQQPVQPAAQNVPFLGVGGAPASELLVDHLGIEGGLVVSLIAPGSPAEKSGLQANDILLSLHGKPIASQDQLKDVIAQFTPGDEVQLEVLRRGEREALTAQLGQREVPRNGPLMKSLRNSPLQNLLGQFPQGGGSTRSADLMQMLHEQMADMDSHFGGMDLGGLFGSGGFNSQSLNDRLQRYRQMFDSGDADVQFEANSSFSFRDNEGMITIQQSGGEKKVTVYDSAGNVTFTGPYETEADKAAVPQDVQERLAGVEFDGEMFGTNNLGKNAQEPNDVPLLEQE